MDGWMDGDGAACCRLTAQAAKIDVHVSQTAPPTLFLLLEVELDVEEEALEHGFLVQFPHEKEN
jgi:hypothetical protein